MSCDCCKEEKAREAALGREWPNRKCKPQNEWVPVDVDGPSFIISLEDAPADLWYINGGKSEAPPDAKRLSDTTLYHGRAGVGYLRCRGRWWVYWKVAGVPAKECFKTEAVGDSSSALLLAELEGLVPTVPGNLPSLKTASLPVLAADTPRQMTAFPVTEGMVVRVTADPRNLDYGFIAGSASCCDDAHGATMLAPGETRSYQITDFSGLFFASPDASAVFRFEVETPTPPVCT